MKNFLRVLSIVTAILAVGAAPAVAMARPPGVGGGGGGGGGAPAAEIGAGILGTLLAGGLALYIRRRNRN
jgi:hypothetical protein